MTLFRFKNRPLAPVARGRTIASDGSITFFGYH
jgi:hypothetical protein